MAVLFLTSSDPEAGLKARRWREKCRRTQQVCIIIYEDETDTHVEIKELKRREGYVDFEPVREKYKMVSSSSGGLESNLTIPGHHSNQELEQVIRQSLRQPRKPSMRFHFPARTVEDSDSAGTHERQVAIAGFVRRLETGQNPMLIFSAEEYEIVSAAILATSKEGPISLLSVSEPQSHIDYRPEVRLNRWPSDLVQEWKGNRGGYVWEPRFSDNIELANGHPVDVTCSRPGIVGNQAVVQISSPKLRGFALLGKKEHGWSIVETSHDEDWGLANWEATEEYFDSLTTEFPPHVPEFEEWCQYPIPFPCPPGKFVQPLTRQESHQIYDWISKGQTAAPGLIIPLCSGLDTNPSALLAGARETFELHLNSAPTNITERLAEMGSPVVLLNSDSPPSISKLIAYWGRDFSLVRVDDNYAEMVSAKEDQKARLDRLSSIFQDAGIRGITFGVADSHFPKFFFVPEGSELARTDHPAPFDHVGAVLISQFYANDQYCSTEKLLSALCRWGDPHRIYTKRILTSAEF